jgi:two-component system, OmpR family, heavy metal sensor histidine kinase CusS
MSSNPAEHCASGASGEAKEAGKAASRRAPWSLTLWLALSSSLSACFILALISLLLYLGLASQLKNQNHLYLHDEVNTLERMLHSRAGDEEVLDEVTPDQSGEEYVKHYIRILDKHEQTIIETRGMDLVARHEQFKLPLKDGRPGVDRQWRTGTGISVLATSVWVDLGKGTGEQGILEVALDVTNVLGILEDFRFKIYGALFGGFLLCIGVSLAIAHRGTRPLREMTQQVRGISISNLEARLAGNNWPRELDQLMVATNLMLARLQDSFERVYNSARNLSHKMRTPLTIMRGEAEVALSRERSVEELQNVMISGLEENRRLERLVENILFLANAEMGKFERNPAQLDLSCEIDKVIDFYSPAAEDKGIGITCQGQALLTADPALVRKAVAALLSNAITFNAPGGTVRFSVRQGEGGSGEVSVSDDGCGIAREEQEKIFDRFYRVYATRYLDPHGTGLGLPIVKAIMELHHGTISIKSDPSLGTTVTLKFP